MISVAVVEDCQSLRETLVGWINSSETLRCVCACTTAKEAFVEVPRCRPSVVVMEVELPGESGITCAARLKARVPGLEVITITSCDDPAHIIEAFRAGISGYLLKPLDREQILGGIAEIVSGGAPISGPIARRVVEMFRPPVPRLDAAGLSPREHEVLALLSSGMSNKHIAARLGISYETVCVHLRRVYDKMHVRSRTEAVIKHLQGRAGGWPLARQQTAAVQRAS